MAHILRETAFGQAVRLITKNKYFKYPEEEPGFQLPEAWLQTMKNTPQRSHPSHGSSAASTLDEDHHDPRVDEEAANEKREENNNSDHNGEPSSSKEQDQLEPVKSIPIVPSTTKDGAILVDWYYSDDMADPHNWSNGTRAFVTAIMALYTFVVYLSSSIFTASEQGVMQRFNVGEVPASLGLSLYVLGYGVGPLLFSPLGEIPRLGRNPIYVVTMFLFVILSIPTAFVQNFAGLMVLRFLQGFFGSPCLASGGATIGDMYSVMNLPYGLMAWVSAAYCGPGFGPLISGYAVTAEGWRWSLYEIIWGAAPVLIIMALLLPETSAPNILLRRAQRIRKLTGDDRFMSQSELDQRGMTASKVVVDALVKPLEISIKDPAVLFVQVYSAIVYCIYYSFFEVFPLVYPVYYGMSLGQVGLVFLCVGVACLLGIAVHGSYLYFYQNPRLVRLGFPNHFPAQEERLIPAIPASFGPVIGLFLFAWTARASIHWIVPTLGIVIYAASAFVVFQTIFIYIPLSYPAYAASLFAANDLFRSALAAGSILFSHPLYANLGVARGTTLLAGLSVTGVIGILLLYIYGARLRSMSKFALSQETTSE